MYSLSIPGRWEKRNEEDASKKDAALADIVIQIFCPDLKRHTFCSLSKPPQTKSVSKKNFSDHTDVPADTKCHYTR